MATLYLLVGYPGAGKTTTSKALHQLTGAEHLWADHIRKEQFNPPTYSEKENNQLYEELNQRTEQLLASGQSVIYDTNFNYAADRQKLRQLAQKHGAETKLLWVQTPREIAKQRATVEAHQHESRVLGSMTDQDFERLTNHLQEPQPTEQPVIVDGTKVDTEYLQSLLKIK